MPSNTESKIVSDILNETREIIIISVQCKWQKGLNVVINCDVWKRYCNPPFMLTTFGYSQYEILRKIFATNKFVCLVLRLFGHSLWYGLEAAV